MTTPVYTVSGDVTLAAAGQLMLHHKVGCLPIVRDAGILERIITVTDMLRALMCVSMKLLVRSPKPSPTRKPDREKFKTPF